MSSAIDHKRMQARKIAQSLLSNILRFNTGRESIITDYATKVLADTIYEHETRICDNCKYYISGKGECGLAYNRQYYKGNYFNMVMHKDDGCRKFERKNV